MKGYTACTEMRVSVCLAYIGAGDNSGKAISSSHSLLHIDNVNATRLRMKLLITGASGFVGWNAVRYFSERDVFVQPTFRSFPHYLHYHSEERVQKPVQLDITDRRTVNEVVNRFRPDCILHCAALARPQHSDNSQVVRTVNIDGTVAIAEAALAAEAQLLFLSTDLVYSSDAGIANEDSPTAPSGAGDYAASKLAAERRVEETGGIWTIVRPTLMFGHGTERSNSFTQFLDRRWNMGEAAPVFSDQVRSFLYVDDLLAALELIMMNRESRNSLYVCGGNESLTRADFATRYAAARGVDRSLCDVMASTELPGYVGGPSDIRLDTSKLQALGWTPRSLTECFREMEENRGKLASAC